MRGDTSDPAHVMSPNHDDALLLDPFNSLIPRHSNASALKISGPAWCAGDVVHMTSA